jgi:hypothetical protein
MLRQDDVSTLILPGRDCPYRADMQVLASCRPVYLGALGAMA